jgi:hypothetical protein
MVAGWGRPFGALVWLAAPQVVLKTGLKQSSSKSTGSVIENNKKTFSESAEKVDPAAEEEQKKEPEPPGTRGAEPQSVLKPAGVAPVAAAATLVSATETVSAFAADEEDEILAEIAEETPEAGSGDDVAP